MSDKHFAIYQYDGYAVLKKIAKNRHKTLEEADNRIVWHINHTRKYIRNPDSQFVIVNLKTNKIVKVVGERQNEIDD
jgi:hypothetical protein